MNSELMLIDFVHNQLVSCWNTLKLNEPLAPAKAGWAFRPEGCQLMYASSISISNWKELGLVLIGTVHSQTVSVSVRLIVVKNAHIHFRSHLHVKTMLIDLVTINDIDWNCWIWQRIQLGTNPYWYTSAGTLALHQPSHGSLIRYHDTQHKSWCKDRSEELEITRHDY
jgi:hypothetical protein